MIFFDIESLHHDPVRAFDLGNEEFFSLISIVVSLKGAIVVLMLRVDHAAEILLR